ncbi:hypothetical protein NC653_005954 [Populus alba x Populus x berolinensis]|uniref:Uncharacterized protein n=1 Tax=Populus alba x Populus x berolinensis TaxID=444605 RepID=A0AAD6RD46_9ROSI|nr:hypothetical protein NC653_005954 [Populus alba x Populus x berolinensis]
MIKAAPSELTEIVAKRRKDFTKEFFVHLYTVAQSYHDNPNEQNALAKLGNDCVATVQAYDCATENMEALNAAELKLQDIINSPSLDAACKKIDDLAEKNQFDSALVLMITKAWSAAKESNMTKDEVKDILYHLYKTAIGNLQRNVPKDIRILKYLLTVEDPEERLCALNDAFTPGEELEGKDVDSLYTTPEKLHTWIKAMVDAYHLSQDGTLMREARDLMNPKIIKKMEELKKLGLEARKGYIQPAQLETTKHAQGRTKLSKAGQQMRGTWYILDRRIRRNLGKIIPFLQLGKPQGLQRVKDGRPQQDDDSLPLTIGPRHLHFRLNEYGTLLKSLNSRRDSLYSKLSVVLIAKGKADDQFNWRVQKNEKLASLREKLHRNKEQLAQGKAKVEKLSQDLKKKNGMLESARNVLEKNRLEQLEKFYPNLICTQSLGHMAITSELLHKQSVVIKQICKLFPQRRVNVDGERNFSGQYDQICNARLPRGLDPHSVSSEELAASLGYMVQLLNLVAHNLAAPTLHNAGFAGSCSRIWQRDSYWNARPSSRSNEYPLFIPRQNYCSTSAENSWTDKSSSNFGVASMESERRPHLDSTRNVPSDTSTFEAFAKLLSTLSSSKEVRSVFNLKMACSRSCKQVQKLNKSVWNVNSAISSSALLESAHALQLMKNTSDNNLPNSVASFLFATEISDGKNESFIDGWDLVEHPTFPPPPSQVEDIEHWTRAMIIDATKK